MTDLDVSVYITGRNCRRTLAQALHSVCAQSAPAAQIVYLDDDSSDDSVGIAGQFADRGVQVLRNDSRMGISISRNRPYARVTRRGSPCSTPTTTGTSTSSSDRSRLCPRGAMSGSSAALPD